MKKLFGKKGFTLIEIVMVIVLLAIIAAFAYPKYIDLRDDAHIAVDQGLIGSLRAWVHIYFAKNKTFPQTPTQLQGVVDDWPTTYTMAQPGGSGTNITITCPGLPSDSDLKATWTYNPTTGTITGTGEHVEP